MLVVDEIENLSALILTQTNYPLRAITAYKNYHNTQKGNFSLAPDHFRGRKLICQLEIKWCLKSLTYLLCNHKSPLAWRCGFANLSDGNERFWQTLWYAGWRHVWQLLSCRCLPGMSTNKGDKFDNVVIPSRRHSI